MRNEVLHGYLIHHRPYRERSHIVYLFTQEYGRIDGILRQTPPPQYQPITLQASGKSELKNFSKLEILHQPIFFFGDAFFTGFYLNELLLRLAPIEVEMSHTFIQYHQTLQGLQQLSAHDSPALFLRQILRQFESALLQDLGYAIDFSLDARLEPFSAQQNYIFQMNEGFVPVSSHSAQALSGQQLLMMQDDEKIAGWNVQQLQLLSKLYRQVLTALLGDRPLKSRQLWIQNSQSKSS